MMQAYDFESQAKRNNNGYIEPKFIRLSTKDMRIPEHAQRQFDKKHGDNIAKHFDPEKFKPIDVSFRDGKYWVIDGQHRMYAIKQIKGGDCTLTCIVHYGMTMHDETEFFLNQLGGVKRIPLTQMIKIRYYAGDPGTVAMIRGAQAAGFDADKFSTQRRKNRIVAYGTLRDIYNSLPYDRYCETLRLLQKAWGGIDDSISREMLLGMAVFVNTYYGEFDKRRLITVLQKESPITIIRDGRIGKTYNSTGSARISCGRSYARVIWQLYNHRCKASKLEDRL